MKLIDKISWLMGRVQKSLSPHLNQCLAKPLTTQEERLVSTLEIVQIERHIPRNVRRYRYPGRKPLDRQACSRAFVAKALYRHPTTSDLRRALQSAENLRQICGFATSGDIPSESTLSRAFTEFTAISLGDRVHDTLVKEYLAEEPFGHISRDSTAIVGRKKPMKKAARVPRRPFVSCRLFMIAARRRMPKGISHHGMVTNFTWMSTTSGCRSVPL